MRPWRSITPSMSVSTASSSRMSSGSRLGRPACRLGSSLTVSSSGSGRRPQPTTVAPRRGELERGRAPEPGARARDDADLPLEQALPEDPRRPPPSARAYSRQPSSHSAFRRAAPPARPLRWPAHEGPRRTEAAERAAARRRGQGATRRRRADALAARSLAAQAIPARRAARSRPCGAGHRHPALQVAVTVPCPAFLIRHPTAGPFLVDTGLHGSVAAQPDRELRPHGIPGRPSPTSSPGKTCRPASRARRRSARDPTGRDDPPPPRPRVGDGGLPWRRPSSSATPSGKRATTGSRPLLRGYVPQHYDYAFDYRTVSFTAGTSSPTRRSAAPSTSSATAASAWPTRLAIRRATCP